MKRYIDADLLKAEVERRITDNTFGAKLELIDILAWLDSLRQEQPSEKTCKNCGFYENNCPYIRGKFIPYPSKVCEDYTYSVIKEQEQSCEDLDKAAKEIATDILGKDYLSELDEDCAIDALNEATNLVKAGAEWQYQKDRREFAKLKAKEWSDGYNDGFARGKEQMLKDAVDGVVYRYESYQRIATAIIVDIPRENLGNKVKIVIIPEKEEKK